MRQTITQNITLEKHDRQKLESGRSIEIMLKNGDLVTIGYDVVITNGNGHEPTVKDKILKVLTDTPQRASAIHKAILTNYGQANSKTMFTHLNRLKADRVVRRTDAGWCLVNGHTVNTNGQHHDNNEKMVSVLEALKIRPMRRQEIAALKKMKLAAVSDTLYRLNKKGAIQRGDYGWEIVNGK